MAKKRTTPPKIRTPKLGRHASGQARVVIDGKHFYLGEYGSQEAQLNYERLILEWRANGCILLPEDNLTVDELLVPFVTYLNEYYQSEGSTPSPELDTCKRALGELSDLYGDSLAADFGPRKLKTLRQVWIERRLCYTTVNRYTNKVKWAFRWATSEEMIPSHISHALQTVENLKAGRTSAKPSRKVAPVSIDHLEALRPHLSPTLRALVDIQLLTGARPGELLRLRPCDIDRSGEVWVVHATVHKNAHRGHRRDIVFGPKAQGVLRPFLVRPSDSYLFSPRESEAWRHQKAEGHRRDDQAPNPKKTDREVRDYYSTASYRRAIEYACARAGLPKIAPNRIRHTAGTIVRREFGLEHAQCFLGHARADVTEIYAERDLRKAIEVARHIG